MRFLGLLFTAALVFYSSAARADDAAPLAEGRHRPIRYAAIELNPLSAIAGHYGGQLQLGIAGPLTIVGGCAYVAHGDSQRYSSYDESTFGVPALAGVMLELGPRIHTAIGNQGAYLWGGISFLHDELHQEAEQSLGPGSHVGYSALDVHRNGVALDAGVHVPLKGHFYLTTGLGFAVRSRESLSNRDDSAGLGSIFTGLAPNHFDRQTVSPRLLLSFGFGS